MMSVIVPVLNGERVILSCLQSLASQKRVPEEVIVVDNGSTDQTVSRVKEWAAAHAQICFRLLTETRKGPSAARNLGAKEAKGELLVFLDADCEAPPQWLERISGEIGRHGGAVGGPYHPSGSVSAIEKYAAAGWIDGNEASSLLLSGPFENRFLLGGNVALPRTLFEKIGGFDEGLKTGEDLDLSIRLRKEGVTLRLSQGLSVLHHGDSSLMGRIRRGFAHGILQSRIARRHFQRQVTISFTTTTWKFPFPVTIAIEPFSLLKILFAVTPFYLLRPIAASWIFLALVLFWTLRTIGRLTRCGVPFTIVDFLAIVCGWTFVRFAMELGRLVGSVRYGVLCW